MGVIPPQSEVALKTAGQRRVNLLWEYTQGGIACAVTITGLVCAAYLVVGAAVNNEMKTAAFSFMVGLANLVVGFYFGRTNHARTGGVGGETVTESGETR